MKLSRRLLLACLVAGSISGTRTARIEVSRALWPYFIAMVILLLLITFVPALSLALPRLFGL